MFNPVVEPSKRHYGANFWDCYSHKIKRDVHFYSELEYEHWIHVETNPNIVDFCEKPIKVKGFVDGKISEATFDMWIKWRDGKEEFVEVAYKKDIQTSESTNRRITVQKEWSKTNNRNYRIFDETQIRKQPLLDNLKVMIPYIKEFDKTNEIVIFSVLKNIQKEPKTIQELLNIVSPIDTYTFYLNIFYLYFQRKIDINIEEQHFNNLSRVWEKNEKL